jgi:hypothetical protein
LPDDDGVAFIITDGTGPQARIHASGAAQ